MTGRATHDPWPRWLGMWLLILGMVVLVADCAAACEDPIVELGR